MVTATATAMLTAFTAACPGPVNRHSPAPSPASSPASDPASDTASGPASSHASNAPRPASRSTATGSSTYRLDFGSRRSANVHRDTSACRRRRHQLRPRAVILHQGRLPHVLISQTIHALFPRPVLALRMETCYPSPRLPDTGQDTMVRRGQGMRRRDANRQRTHDQCVKSSPPTGAIPAPTAPVPPSPPQTWL